MEGDGTIMSGKKRKPRHMIDGVRKKVALKMGKDPLVSKIKQVVSKADSSDIELTEHEVTDILKKVLVSKKENTTVEKVNKVPPALQKIESSQTNKKRDFSTSSNSIPHGAVKSVDQKMNTENRVLVTGIPFEALKNDIEIFFKSYGDVIDVALPLKRGSAHKHMGLAFITYSNRSEVLAALGANGASWPNSQRFIKVVEAEDKKTVIRDTANPLPDMTSVSRPENCYSVYIGNLSPDVTEDILRESFNLCGEITRVNLPKKEGSEDSRGFAHVTFLHEEDTEKAVRLNGTVIGKWKVKVDYAPNKPFVAAAVTTKTRKGDKKWKDKNHRKLSLNSNEKK